MTTTSSASTIPLVVIDPPSPTQTVPRRTSPTETVAQSPSPIRPSSSYSEPSGKLLTYKYGTNMAYVARMEDYQDAVQLVRSTWPALSAVPDDRISFKITSGQNRVVITPSAWRDLTRSIRNYQTVAVCIAGSPKITLNDGAAPPTYEEANEKRSHSRSSSSSSRSGSRASSKSPRLATRALELLSGKRS